jgi:hypothetical protein
MKFILITMFALCICTVSFSQSPNYRSDLATVFETVKGRAFKSGYKYVITYDSVNNASVFVKPNKSYLIYYVYDNKSWVSPNFLAYLMTDKKEIQKKYTASPLNVGSFRSASVSRLDFATKNFGAEKLPVKIEAKPNATIYIFEK